MLKQKFPVIFAPIFFLGLIFSFYLISHFRKPKSVDTASAEKVENDNDQTNLLDEPITILLLGLDSRKGDPTSRCDAIHLVTFSPPEEKIIITSVPRNARVDLPEVATPSAYLANLCEQRGIDAGVSEIIRITNLQPDHTIKINFSQTLGILRLLGMPTTPTLQFLRNRTSYLIGGYQRSHNQALFLKDMILHHTEQVSNLPKPMKQIIFKMVDADGLDFETANSILNWVVKNNLWQKPEKIELTIKPLPWYKVIDIHFAASDYPSEISWQDNEEFKNYQSELENYLKNLIETGEKCLASDQKDYLCQLLKTPFSQQLWLQLEDNQLRNQLHFDLLRLYFLSSGDKEKTSVLLDDFITEMEVIGETELKKKAEELSENMLF